MITEGARYRCSPACDGTLGVGDSAAACHSRARPFSPMVLLSSRLGPRGVGLLVQLHGGTLPVILATWAARYVARAARAFMPRLHTGCARSVPGRVCRAACACTVLSLHGPRTSAHGRAWPGRGTHRPLLSELLHCSSGVMTAGQCAERVTVVGDTMSTAAGSEPPRLPAQPTPGAPLGSGSVSAEAILIVAVRQRSWTRCAGARSTAATLRLDRGCAVAPSGGTTEGGRRRAGGRIGLPRDESHHVRLDRCSDVHLEGTNRCSATGHKTDIHRARPAVLWCM